MADLSRRFLPTDAWVRFVLAPALVFIALAGDHNYLADFWHHLARGRAIVQDGALLDHDIFTYTVPGESFQDVNWLSQVVYYRLFAVGGLALVRVANAALLALTVALLVNMCRRRSGSLIFAMAAAVFTVLGLWQVLTIRPQTFSLLLFVVLYDLLERARQKPWLLMLAPLLMTLWVNLHGAFPAGLFLVVGAFLEAAWQAWLDRRRRLLGNAPAASPGHWQALAVCLGACLLATLANPYGWNIYGYVGVTSARAAARRIDEWVPPGFDTGIGLAFFVSLLLLVVFGLLARRRLGTKDILLLALFLPLALGSVRMVAWWLLLAAPVLADFLAAIWPAARDAPAAPSPTTGASLAFLALLAVAVSSVPGLQSYNPLLAARANVGTERALDAALAKFQEDHSRGRLFARLEWGEYLGWIGSPQYQVFMDGRIEIFPDKVWEEYTAVTLGKAGWQEVFDRYEVDALILDSEYHGRTGLLRAATESIQWRKVYESGQVLLFVRPVPTSHP